MIAPGAAGLEINSSIIHRLGCIFMTPGLIHTRTAGDLCPQCRSQFHARDWTCPRCGHILDRYLFSTVTARSVTGRDKEAYQAGYAACMERWKSTGSVEISAYRPPAGHETAYRAGWQRCSARIEGRAERKRGRRRGFVLLGTGTLLTAVGAPMAVYGFQYDVSERVVYIALGAGLLNLAFGLVAIITGRSDE
jgi:hypothetical protein